VTFLNRFFSAFSQPKTDKLLFQTIRELKPRNIVEVGIGDGKRTSQILNAASEHGDVRYCVLDMFETSPPGTPHLTLKEAHRQLSSPRAKVRLLPGDTTSTLRRSANELIGTDLLVIAATQSTSLDAIWSYAPRMLLDTSRVLIEAADGSGWKALTRADVPHINIARGKRAAA
jgi:hypothetical protein